MPRCIVSWIKANYVQPLGVEDLAEMADMGVSTLHHHFPAMTAMSPLHFQNHPVYSGSLHTIGVSNRLSQADFRGSISVTGVSQDRSSATAHFPHREIWGSLALGRGFIARNWISKRDTVGSTQTTEEFQRLTRPINKCHGIISIHATADGSILPLE
jgi:hypothetical protein